MKESERERERGQTKLTSLFCVYLSLLLLLLLFIYFSLFFSVQAIFDSVNNLPTKYFRAGSRPFVFQEVIDLGEYRDRQTDTERMNIPKETGPYPHLNTKNIRTFPFSLTFIPVFFHHFRGDYHIHTNLATNSTNFVSIAF